MARHMMKAAALQSHSGGGASVPSSPLKRMANAKADDAGAADADAEAESALQDETEAEAEAEADAELEEYLRKDGMWSKFLGDDDDAFNASSFASEALASGSAAWCSEKLAQGMAAVEKRLRAEVIGKGKGKGKEQGQVVLLGQVGAVAQVQAAVEQLRSGVEALQGCAGRIRAEMAEPYRVIRRRTTQLANVHSAIALLQYAVRLLRLVGKLRSAMAADDAEVDLAKAAQLFNEIEELRGEGEGEAEGDVDVVEQHLPWLRDAGDRLRLLAGAALQSAMESLNQAEVASALQVFFNMGELKNTVDGMINKYRDQASKTVSWALDMKAVSTNMGPSFGPGGIQRSGMPQIGSGAKAKEGLWQRMSSCMDNLHAAMVAVWHLQRVLSKKRDPFTHVLFLDQVVQEGEPMLTDRVWVVVVKAFTNQMKSAFTTSSFVKETLVLSYPKLLSLFENLIDRISQDTNIKGVSPAIRPEGKDSLLATIEPFQTAFLAHCLSSLSNLVSNLFPVSSGGTVPSQEQISRFISRIQEEIEAVKLHAHLTLMILREIGKVLHLLAEKAEYQISTGPESRQVIGPATAAQVKNFAICLHLQEVHSRITVMVSGLPAVAMEVLSPSLGAIYGVAVDAVTPLFQAMLDRLENCILQIHEQNFGGDDLNAGMDENGSTYMEEVQKAIVHFRSEFLSKLLSPSSHLLSISGESICARLTRKMAARVLTYFVRHASLVRPLSESGKLRLTRDMAELELVVGQNLFPVEQLGVPYRALRALKTLFFQETSKLASSPFLQDLPRSVVLHHIYSRAPDELESPMQRTKLTPKQYSLWLDSQGEEQIWKGVKATLDDYAAKVGARGDKEFSPVYPLMLQLGSPLSGPSHVSKGN